MGIGHAGTLISAILLLFRQGWRTGVNRAAEAMTIFAVMCAGQFPIWHMGRVWMAFYVLPYPNTRGPLWSNFNSPLLWDVFAISTYFTVSLLFWYCGLLPDLATVSGSRKTEMEKTFYGVVSFGWTGSAPSTGKGMKRLSLVLAGLATPLVLSVHTIVSFDFATSIVPGWHTTIFPPYFVAGAIFSGFAMVQSLLIITRKVLHLEEYITLEHIDVMNKVIVLTGSIVGVAYLTELFIAWYGQNKFEGWAFMQNRVNLFSPLGWAYYIMMGCNVLYAAKSSGSVKNEKELDGRFFMAVIVNIGMWFERFVIIVTSVYRDYLPHTVGVRIMRHLPGRSDFTSGTFGFIFTCYFSVLQILPGHCIGGDQTYIEATSGENYKRRKWERRSRNQWKNLRTKWHMRIRFLKNEIIHRVS